MTTIEEDLGPQIRLLVCRNCRTVDELPDYAGDPAQDHLLTLTIERHHVDPVTKLEHMGHLVKVPVKHWSRLEVRKEILKQINEGSPGLSVFDAAVYDSRSTFHDDAMTCYNKHRRPKGRCPDWKHESKRLTPDTAADRKEAGLPKLSKAGPGVFSCDFCPCKVFMATQAKKDAGLYG